MIKIVLMEPENSCNVGAVARVMANFDFAKLVLINPKCVIDEDSRKLAKHAGKVLDDCEIQDFLMPEEYDYLIGTTSQTGSDFNIPRSPLTPEEFTKKIIKISEKRKFGLLFGREGHGLFNEEIKLCDFIVTIPSSDSYKTLNLSHSVAVMLYELSKKENLTKCRQVLPIEQVDKLQIQKMFDELFGNIKFSTPGQKETQKSVWKRVIGKAMLTKREAFAIMGLLNKLVKLSKAKLSVVVKEKKQVKKKSNKKKFDKKIQGKKKIETKKENKKIKKKIKNFVAKKKKIVKKKK